MKTKLSLFFGLIISALVAAGVTPQTLWSLEDCIDYALEHNLDIQFQRYNEITGSYDLKQSYGNFLPNLNAESTQGFSYGRSVDPFTNEFSTERIMRQNASASSSMVLFAGFQNVNYLRYQMLRNTALKHDTEGVQNELILTISAAYMQILYNEDFVETARQQTEVIRQQLERTRMLYQGGTLPRGSVLEMEARLAEEELNVINAENNLRLAYLELIQLLDLDPADDFDIQRPDIEMTEQFVLTKPEAAYDRAMQVEPKVKAANTRILVAERQIALERGRMSPTISLIGSLSTGYSEASQQFVGQENFGPVQVGYLQDETPVYADDIHNIFERKPYRDQIRDNFSQFVGFSLRIPIFNRLDVRTRIQHSKVDLDRAQNRYELTRNNLHKTIHQAHADALAAWQKYQATIKSLDAFSESFDYTRQRFELGMVSSVEFNEAQTRLASAEREALQAKYDFVFKMKIMEFYMGEGIRL